MRLVVGVLLLALTLAGCAEPKGESSAAGAVDASSGADGPDLGAGVTRSPSPSATGKSETSRAPRRPPAVKVTLLRSGGVAGVRDELVVAKSGRWTYTTRRDTETGRLSGTLTTRLHRLANDPRLAAEAKRGESGFGDGGCADAFQYRLTAGDVTVNQRGCGDQPDRPVYQKIVGLLSDHTAF